MCIAEAYFTLGYVTPTVPLLLSLKVGNGLLFFTFLLFHMSSNILA